MVITRLLGKWKVSQNQLSQNQASLIAGLRARGLPDTSAMAELVESRAKKSI
jgi:transcriptional regulator